MIFTYSMLLQLSNCVTDNGLTKIRNAVVMIAMQSQLKDYVPTGDAAEHNSEPQGCLCKRQGAAVSALKCDFTLIVSCPEPILKKQGL